MLAIKTDLSSIKRRNCVYVCANETQKRVWVVCTCHSYRIESLNFDNKTTRTRMLWVAWNSDELEHPALSSLWILLAVNFCCWTVQFHLSLLRHDCPSRACVCACVREREERERRTFGKQTRRLVDLSIWSPKVLCACSQPFLSTSPKKTSNSFVRCAMCNVHININSKPSTSPH